jgi:hypothetical protein
MALPNSKDIYNVFLLLLFLCVLLVLLRYIRSREGFADLGTNAEPAPEEYDLNLFFKTYPLLDVCPIFKSIYDQIVKGESTDAQGKPIPNDIAQENANKKVATEITTGVFPCPFEFPTSKDLNIVADYVEKLDQQLLSKAKLTLMFCVVSLQSTLDGAKKSMAKIPKEEGFISECSPEELQYKDIVPLQCIPAETMKATEKEEIDKMDKQKQIQIVAKKQSIAKRLATIYNNYKQFDTDYAAMYGAATQSMMKQVLVAEKTAKLAEDKAKDSEDEGVINRAAKAKEDAETKKIMLDRLIRYQKIVGKSISELVSEAKKLQAEIEALQKNLQSGKLSF